MLTKTFALCLASTTLGGCGLLWRNQTGPEQIDDLLSYLESVQE